MRKCQCIVLFVEEMLTCRDSSCDKTNEIVIQLYVYRRKFGLAKEKVQVFSETVTLQDDELYTEKKYHSKWSPC